MSPAVAGGSSAAAPTAGTDELVLVGKRYVDEETGLELLCVKTGDGPLSAEGRPLHLKEAKRLPASD